MMLYLVLEILFVNYVLSNPLANREIAQPRANNIEYRLPKTVNPSEYVLSLEPNFEKDSFTGSVSITITVTAKTSSITIHQKELTIKKENVEITNLSNQKINVKGVNTVPEKDFLIIDLATNLNTNEAYIIKFTHFEGKLNKENDGFYLAHFIDNSGKTRKFATTQFEATSARRAFPCFDEPEYKAIFHLSIIKPNDTYLAIANTPEVTTLKNKVTFEPTPKMSTYLLAFIISEMKLSEKLGIYRVLAKPQDITSHKEKCALEIGNATIVHLQNYLNVPYGLQKMDQAAVPDEYFTAGAMENWGLVIYRESALLCSPETTAIRKQSITTIIGHEFAHQWFGNLVSPAWWRYIWLNEGFATYFETIAADLVYPHMDIMKQFLVRSVHGALLADSSTSTRELNMEAESPREIAALFDTIAYDKGGSVIRMMDGFLTTPVFRKGITNYLNQMRHKVATPTNLYNAIQEVIDETVTPILPTSLNLADIMTTWDSLKGYPVVSVTRHYGKTTNNVHLSQARFTMRGSIEPKKSWKIPINFVSANYPSFSDTTADVWLTVYEKNETVPYVSDSDWIIVNKKQTGYYRVNYDENNWNLIKDALLKEHDKIDVLNRAQIIDDTFNLARSGRLSYDVAIAISTYLKNEKEYVAFYPFFQAIGYLDYMLYFTNSRDKLKSHVRNVLQEIYQSLNFNETSTDKHTDILNRGNIIKWLCRMGHSECRSLSLQKFSSWKNGTGTISVNLRPSIFCGAMRTGDAKDHEFLYTKAKGLQLDERDLRSAMINALGCSENEEILNTYLSSSIEDNSKFGPDLIIPSVYTGGDVGLKAVLNFLTTKDNFKKVEKRSSNIMRLLNNIGSLISGDEQLKQLQTISENNNATLFTNALKYAKMNKEWLSTTGLSFTSALEKVSSGVTLHINVAILTITCTIANIFYY